MIAVAALPWCQSCQAEVEACGGSCPYCGGPVLSDGHPTSCYRRPRVDLRSVSSDEHPALPDQAPPRTVKVDPMERECARCKQWKRHQPRSDRPSKPRSYCRECMIEVAREWREKNWDRAKARHTWKDMIRRCYDPNHGRNCPPGIPRYSDFGGKGITVCKRWLDDSSGFDAFLSDLGLPPAKDSTLDRINPKRNYTPSNCRWTDPHTQAVNRTTTHWLLAEDPTTGEEVELCLTDWQRRTGVHRCTIHGRLKRGWHPDDAVRLPPLKPGERYHPPGPDDEVPF